MRQFVLREESQCRALYAYLRHNWPAMAAQGKPLADEVARLNETIAKLAAEGHDAHEM